MRGRKTTEDYLKTIYILSRSHEVHGCMIAEELGVSRPTVSVLLRKLEAEGFIKIDCMKAVTLTENGLQLARSVYERYEVLRRFLIHLGVEESEAYRDACEMEHGLGDESLKALKNLACQIEKQQSF